MKYSAPHLWLRHVDFFRLEAPPITSSHGPEISHLTYAHHAGVRGQHTLGMIPKQIIPSHLLVVSAHGLPRCCQGRSVVAFHKSYQ